MAGVAEFFRWLNDAHGLNFSIFYDAYDRERFLLGLWTTIYISVVCIFLSVVIGVFGAWLQGGAFPASCARWCRAMSSSSATRRRWCSSFLLLRRRHRARRRSTGGALV